MHKAKPPSSHCRRGTCSPGCCQPLTRPPAPLQGVPKPYSQSPHRAGSPESSVPSGDATCTGPSTTHRCPVVALIWESGLMMLQSQRALVLWAKSPSLWPLGCSELGNRPPASLKGCNYCRRHGLTAQREPWPQPCHSLCHPWVLPAPSSLQVQAELLLLPPLASSITFSPGCSHGWWPGASTHFPCTPQ